MVIHESKDWVLVAAFSLLASAALPQSQAPQNPSADAPARQSPAPKADKKRLLEEATRVSTSEAAKSAAQEETAKHAASETSEGSSASDVLELQRAARSSAAARTVVAPPKDSKKSVAKNVHGTVYGSADPQATGNRRKGGAVGASSKSGKSSIYVETDQGRSTSSSPH
jgi:hypothetical protein